MLLRPWAWISGLLFAAASASHAEDIRWNGFINVIGGVLQKAPTQSAWDNLAPAYLGYTNDLTFDRETSAGLQAMYPLDDKTSVTLQAFASGGQDEYASSIKWLYATYIPTEHSTFRIGRIGSPIFLYSDFLNVGYVYHWAKPPTDVYNYDTTVTGIDYIYQNVFDTNDWSLEFTLGSQDQYVPATEANLTTRNGIGGVFTFTHDGWLTFRSAYFQMQATFDSDRLHADNMIDAGFETAVAQGILDQATANVVKPLLAPTMAPLINEVIEMTDEPVQYGEFAVRIDKGSWFSVAEWSTFRTDTYVFGHLESWYLSTGVRLDSAVWHLTYSRYDQYAKKQVYDDYYSTLPLNPTLAELADYYARQIRATPAIAAASQWNTVTLGVSVDTSANTALKFEVLYFEQDATVPTETGGIGSNMLFRTALSATF